MKWSANLKGDREHTGVSWTDSWAGRPEGDTIVGLMDSNRCVATLSPTLSQGLSSGMKWYKVSANALSVSILWFVVVEVCDYLCG